MSGKTKSDQSYYYIRRLHNNTSSITFQSAFSIANTSSNTPEYAVPIKVIGIIGLGGKFKEGQVL